MDEWMESWEIPAERELAPERVASHRAALLQAIANEDLAGAGAAAPQQRRRVRPAVAVAVTVALLAGGGAAAAGIQAVQHRANNAVTVEVGLLDVIYDGHRISTSALEDLQSQGKGLFTATDLDTAIDLKASRAFDTEQELDAYTEAYLAWQTASAAGTTTQTWGEVTPETWTAP